jgi:hypothetical protein
LYACCIYYLYESLIEDLMSANMPKPLKMCYLIIQRIFRAVDQKHLESFEMWCWRMMEKISWTDHVRNEEVLLRVSEQRNILHEIRKQN